MTYAIEDLRQRALELRNEMPTHVSVMCLNGATVGYREVLEDLLYSIHEILDILVRTYSTMEGSHLSVVKNDAKRVARSYVDMG